MASEAAATEVWSGFEPVPVGDLVAHHAVGREREPRRDVRPADVLDELEAVRQRRRGDDAADRARRAADRDDRRLEGDDVCVRRARKIGAGERDTPRGFDNTRLERSRVERQVAWHRLFFPAPTNSARFPTPKSVTQCVTDRPRSCRVIVTRPERKPGPARAGHCPRSVKMDLRSMLGVAPAQPSPTSSLRARGQLQPHAVPPEENQDTRLFTEIPFALRTLGYVRDGQTGPSPRHSFGTARVMVANPAIKLVKAKGLALEACQTGGRGRPIERLQVSKPSGFSFSWLPRDVIARITTSSSRHRWPRLHDRNGL